MTGCNGCGKEQKFINDLYKQELINAQELANRENKSVVVFIKDNKYTHALYTGIKPERTRKIIEPLQ